jgi:hypothetical protein
MSDTTPSPEQLAAQTEGSLFFGAEDPPEPMPEPAPENPQVSELKGQLAAMAKQIEQMQQTNMTLMMRPEGPAQQFQSAPPAAPAPEPLPDPLDDAEGYANALSKRITQQVAESQMATQSQQQQQAAAQSKYNDLWENFQIVHKDYANDFRRVKYAANIAAENVAKRGIDVEKYMFTYSDQFMNDVTSVMDEIFGKPGAKPNDPPVPGLPTEPARTGGMFGGTDSGGRPAPAAPLAEDNAFADIREWQIKSGFHR